MADALLLWWEATREAIVSETSFLTLLAMAVFSLAGMVLCAMHHAFLWLSERIAWLRLPRWLLPEDLRPPREPARWR